MNIKTNKNSALRKVLGVFFVIFVFLASTTAIVFSSLNIANKTNLSSDYDQGIGYSLRFKLVDKDNNNLYNDQGEIKDKSFVLDKLNNTATIIGHQLQEKGLTHVSVSSGLGTYSYTDNGIKNIPIGYVNMKFENSPAVFGITNEENDAFLNASKISSKIGNSNRYEFETVASGYYKYTNSISLLPSTQRDNQNASIIANEAGKSENKNYFLVSSKDNLSEDIQKYKSPENVVDSNAVQLVQKNYYYLEPFIKEKHDFDQIEDTTSRLTTKDDASSGDDNSTDTSKPDYKAKFQTKHTWLLWKDKSKLINYLNSLVLSSYYNIYANNIPKDKIISDKYNIGTPDIDHSTNTNTIDTKLRKQINTYLDSLSSLEKNIVKFFTSNTTGEPHFVNEKNLMGFLYEFYNSSYNPTNNVGIPGSLETDKIIDPNTHSKSELEGWSFLETDNSDFNELLSSYLIGKFDYSNFSQFFQNPKPPKDDENNDTNSNDPIYYTTNKFKLPNQTTSIDEFIKELNNQQYSFPILDISKDNDIDKLQNVINVEIAAFQKDIIDNKYGSTAEEIFKNDERYQKRLKEIASNFNFQKIFGDISKTIPRYEMDAVYNFPVFNIFLICLSAIILIIGIIVSILYRVPGALAFILSALTFTGSIAFFNLFGFTFSFFSFIGLLFGTVISFLTPFFVFRNFKKEILEGASIFGAFVKTMKKYWKLSLDVHVVAALVSFSFLFFGKNQIIDFGAVLTISTFLSIILSGIIFFLCISLIVSLFSYLSPGFFMTKSLFLRMKKFSVSMNETSLNGFEVKESKITKKIQWNNYYNKIWFWATISFGFISLIGLILLFVIGPGKSIDFSGGYILQIFNYDKFSEYINISTIPNYAGGAYIYDNVLYVPVSLINNDQIFNWIDDLSLNGAAISDDLKNLMLNSYSITEFNSSIPLSVVDSTWKCFGISIGFVAIWILISINWIAILPYLLVQLISIVSFIGWLGITRFEANVETISIAALAYLVSSIYCIGILSSIKISWDRSKPLSFEELKKLTNSIIFKINANFINILLIFIGVAVLISVVSLNKLLIVSFIALIINVLFILITTPHIILPLWHLSIKMKNVYIRELSNSSFNKTKVKTKNYDDIDEQIVKGLNHK